MGCSPQVGVEWIVIAGSAGLKNELVDNGFLDQRIQEKILKVMDIASSGRNGLNQAIGECTDIFANTQLMKQRIIVSELMNKMVNDTALVAIGKEEVITALNMVGLVEHLVIHQDSFADGGGGGGGVEEEFEKDEKSENNMTMESVIQLAQSSGAHVDVISVQCAETHQFLHGLGGIAAVLRYAVDLHPDLDQGQEDQDNNENFSD